MTQATSSKITPLRFKAWGEALGLAQPPEALSDPAHPLRQPLPPLKEGPLSLTETEGVLCIRWSDPGWLHGIRVFLFLLNITALAFCVKPPLEISDTLTFVIPHLLWGSTLAFFLTGYLNGGRPNVSLFLQLFLTGAAIYIGGNRVGLEPLSVEGRDWLALAFGLLMMGLLIRMSLCQILLLNAATHQIQQKFHLFGMSIHHKTVSSDGEHAWKCRMQNGWTVFWRLELITTSNPQNRFALTATNLNEFQVLIAAVMRFHFLETGQLLLPMPELEASTQTPVKN